VLLSHLKAFSRHPRRSQWPRGLRHVMLSTARKLGSGGSNPARGMDVYPRFSVLCCPVSVEALRRADPPSKESCQMSILA
jgi:hypothetical protein